MGFPGRRVAYGPANAARVLGGLAVHVYRVVVAVAEASVGSVAIGVHGTVVVDSVVSSAAGAS